MNAKANGWNFAEDAKDLFDNGNFQCNQMKSKSVNCNRYFIFGMVRNYQAQFTVDVYADKVCVDYALYNGGYGGWFRIDYDVIMNLTDEIAQKFLEIIKG